jgi:CBS domain-containing protein
VIIPPETTLKDAAQKMEAIDCGALPVGTRDKILGIITDRDIVIRAVSRGKDVTKEQVKDYMTKDVQYCATDDTADTAGQLMGENGISRLLVEDENGKPCGILTFGRIIRNDNSRHEIAQVIECAVGRKAA